MTRSGPQSRPCPSKSKVDDCNALDSARSQMKDALMAIHQAIGKVQAVAATVRQLCEPDEHDVIHEPIVAAVDSLGVPDSSEYGLLEDLAVSAMTAPVSAQSACQLRQASQLGNAGSPADADQSTARRPGSNCLKVPSDRKKTSSAPKGQESYEG
jgi:hypothetical protein